MLNARIAASVAPSPCPGRWGACLLAVVAMGCSSGDGQAKTPDLTLQVRLERAPLEISNKFSRAFRDPSRIAAAAGEAGTADGTAVNVTFASGVSQRAAERMLQQHGGEAAMGRRYGTTYASRMSDGDLLALAALDDVNWIGLPRPGIESDLHNAWSAAWLRIPEIVSNTPAGLTGAGIRVGVFDGGWVDPNHPDLAGRVRLAGTADYEPDLLPYELAIEDHPTHVAGTIASSGQGDPAAKGMAPEAEIFSFGVTDFYLDDLLYLVESADLWVTNASTGGGDGAWGEYGPVQRMLDQIIEQTDVAMVWSAGNDGWPGDSSYTPGGWGSVANGSVAKNTFSVGGVGGTSETPTQTWARDKIFSLWWSSSSGPTDNGRLKPEFVARAKTYSLWDTVSMPSSPYGMKEGTSQAAPALSGAIALLHEHWLNLYSGRLPLSLLRSVLVQTADDLNENNTYPFNSSPNPSLCPQVGPDYLSGWGLPDVAAAAALLSAPARWRLASVEQGESLEITVWHPGGPLKATLAWVDPAATTVTPALLHDLDIELVAPNQSIVRPWVLDPANPEAPATTGINTVDVQEQVFVQDPPPGLWTLRIHGTRIDTAGPAPFAVTTDSDHWDRDTLVAVIQNIAG